MIGFRALSRQRHVSPVIVDKFGAVPVANINDVMSRMTAGGPSLRPLHSKGIMAGPAVTVKTRQGDNLMAHHAINTVERGDVIFVDAGGDLTNAIVGELILTDAKVMGLAGIVVHGAVRDYGWIKSNEFLVYASGVTHRGPYKDGPGELNVPIAVGGMVIEPGDLVLGDGDGICAFRSRVQKTFAQRRRPRTMPSRPACGHPRWHEQSRMDPGGSQKGQLPIPGLNKARWLGSASSCVGN